MPSDQQDGTANGSYCDTLDARGPVPPTGAEEALKRRRRGLAEERGLHSFNPRTSLDGETVVLATALRGRAAHDV